ncbi:MAG TPA: EfeM/EfeO family lipoprotein [Pseudonocardiaceae bacterium]|nr:EfeM/EfeO family lipoprotein [Pseudonocardiaceae bacterium]
MRSVRFALLGVVVLATALIGATPDASNLRVGPDGCGVPPSRLAAGPVALTVANEAKAFVAVYLINPAGEVFAEIPSLTPGKSLPLSTTVGAGTYAVRCVFTDGTVRTSSTITVTGSTNGAVPGFVPLPDLAMTGPVNAYRDWVGGQLPGLLTACQQLAGDVDRGDVGAAKADWLTAHLDYERLGAAYNSFGDFDQAIDGRADGLPLGTADPSWSGFHALEYALWHGGADAASLAHGLVDSVNGLIADFPSEEVDPGDLPLRAHEILENAMQFQLTGMADYGSGTTLATLYANTQGTAEVLSVLKPLIGPRDPGLPHTIDADLAAVQGAVVAAEKGEPGARQRMDGELGGLLEELAQVPDLLAPRTSG